jgi:hypothetical protein
MNQLMNAKAVLQVYAMTTILVMVSRHATLVIVRVFLELRSSVTMTIRATGSMSVTQPILYLARL